LTPEDHRVLERRCPSDPAIISRGFGNCRIRQPRCAMSGESMLQQHEYADPQYARGCQTPKSRFAVEI
jgi:hypothetical protein